MKTLWERLSEEKQLILLERQTTHPLLYSRIISELKSNYAFTELTVSTANKIICDLTINKTDFINDLHKIFSNE